MIVRTYNSVAANQIMRHARVYPHITDDFCPPAEEFDCSSAMDFAGNYFLQVGEPPEGIFFFHPHSSILFEVHTCLLPSKWGKPEVAMEAAKWMFANSPCEKIITWIPEYNKVAYRYALKAGMKAEGFCTKSLRKDGRLQGMYLLGLEKPCQQQSQ